MKINLSQEKIAIIDDEDFEKVNKYKWTYQKAYTGKVDNCEYAVAHTEGSHKTRKRIYLHRFILNANKGQWVDHINRNGLDCRKENLRFCNNSTNQANRIAGVNKKYSKHKGVCFYKKSKKWMASIRKDGKTLNLGSFDTEYEAAKAYNKIAKALFGDFAILNKI